MTSRCRLARVDMTDNDKVDMDLLLAHVTRTVTATTKSETEERGPDSDKQYEITKLIKTNASNCMPLTKIFLVL